MVCHLSARGCQRYARRQECETGTPSKHDTFTQCWYNIVFAHGGPTMYQHWENVSCLLLVIVCIGLLTKHADWPITARELTAELTARELKICIKFYIYV